MAANDLANLSDEAAAENSGTIGEGEEGDGGASFVLSSQPIVESEQRAPSAASRDFENLGELPRSYGGAFLFAIARDPHTLFAYWDIDWAEVFGDNPPADRKVHLRILWHEGIEESTAAVEQWRAPSHFMKHARSLTASRSVITLRMMFGFCRDSSAVITPPDELPKWTIDVATIPFHLSFQRIVDAFRGSKYDGDALAEIVGRLQHHADHSDATLPQNERELLRTLESGLSGTGAAQRSRLRNAQDVFATRQRIESILGFGATSPPRRHFAYL